MGHGQKNANRGAAINRNAARIQKLAEKLGEIKDELSNDIGTVRKELKDDVDALVDELEEFQEETEERLRLLERSIWRKIMDRFSDKKRKPEKTGDPANPNHRAVFGDRSAVKPLDKNEDKKGGDDGEDEHSDD